MTAKSDIEKITEERLIYKTEMMKAIACRKKKDKIALAAEWKAKYSEMTYNALIMLARNHSASSLRPWVTVTTAALFICNRL